MKRSSSIVIGSILAGLMAACATPEPDSTEVCVDESMTILPAPQCEDGDGHGSFIYVPSSTYVGAHGSKYTGTHSSTRPASGTIGRAPSSGGFGTHGGTAGG